MNPEQNQETRGKCKCLPLPEPPSDDCPVHGEGRWYIIQETMGGCVLAMPDGTQFRCDVPIEIATQILDALNSQSQWIRVEDRLPDKPLEYYLVFCPDKRKDKIRRAFLSVENEFIRNSELLKATHWRNLPTPPKD